MSPVTDATGGPDPEWGKEEAEEIFGPGGNAAWDREHGSWTGDGEHGFWQMLPPGPLPEPRDLDPEEQREAAQRYIQARYAQSTTPWVDPDVIRGIERVTGETYRDGRWYQEPAAVDEYPEGERDE